MVLKNNNRKNGRFTIGLAIDWLNDPYHLRIMRGIKRIVKKYKYNMISFTGGILRPEWHWEAIRNRVYDMIDRKNIDALVISSGSLAHTSDGIRALTNVSQRFTGNPMVSIGLELEGIPSVIVDNTTGLKELLCHLINDHHCKKLAFIKGYIENRDVIDRERVFIETLEEYGISCSECWIIAGEFTKESGKTAVKVLLDLNNAAPDAIVAANDLMALGVIEELQSRGINIPGEILVTGFDDHDMSRLMVPTLSTVYQPLEDMGAASIEHIHSLLEGREVPLLTTLLSVARYRESCGCKLEFSKDIFTTKFESLKNTFLLHSHSQESSDAKRIETYLYDLHKNFKLEYGQLNIPHLIGAFAGSLKEHNPVLFIENFNNTMNLILDNYHQWSYYQFFLLSLRNSVLVLSCKTEDHLFAEELLLKAHDILNKFFERTAEDEYSRVKGKMILYSYFSEYLLSFGSANKLTEFIHRNFPAIGISLCSFSLFEEMEDGSLNRDTCRVLLAYNKSGIIKTEKDNLVFPSANLVPDEILPTKRTFALNIEPLWIEDTFIGLIALEYLSGDKILFDEIMRMLVNLALKALILIQKSKKQSSKITEANRKLQATLEELKETQQKLVESEKIAALGTLVSGIAHEINTPVGVSITATSHIELLTKKILDRFLANNLKKSDLEEFLHKNLEASKMILSNLRKTDDLVQRFKRIDFDRSAEARNIFNVKKYLEDIFLSLGSRLRQQNVKITIECDDKLTIYSYPQAFMQILGNLISNTLTHAFENQVEKKISVSVKKSDGYMVLIYSNNGKEILPDNLKKIFEPFFTTNRREGRTGLGLNIIHNLVSQTLHGSITCSSRENEGASFIITIPLE